MSEQINATCAHDSCGCRKSSHDGVVVNGQWFCSSACAEGRGCEHADCRCGATPQKKSPGDATAPAQPHSPTKPAAKENPGHHVDFNPAQGGPATRRDP